MEVLRQRANARRDDQVHLERDARHRDLVRHLGSAIGGIDAVEVMRGVHLIPVRHWAHSAVSRTMRAGPTAFYEARCGYGGSCL